MKNNIYDFYKEHYNLKKINLNISHKDILFLVYDDKYYYYLNENKFIDYANQKDILNLMKKISKKYKIDIINYYPVCFCVSTLVIAIRVVSSSATKLKRFDIEKMPSKYKKLVDYHKKHFEMYYLSSSVAKEIQTSQKYIGRYKFHEKFIKKYLLTYKKRRKKEFNELMLKLIPFKSSIIDISCGDNKDIFDIAMNKNYDLIVGNDICIKYMEEKTNENVMYTNDDVIFNNIKDESYDVAFCKNTLHHMNDVNAINNMLLLLNRISKHEILIVEICNPRETGGLPKFLNKWLYTKFLKDAGSCFLNESQFKKIIEHNFNHYKIDYYTFTNILGTYMIAKIRKDKLYENKSRN